MTRVELRCAWRQDIKLCDIVDEMEQRVALMLKAPVPSLAQKAIARRSAELALQQGRRPLKASAAAKQRPAKGPSKDAVLPLSPQDAWRDDPGVPQTLEGAMAVAAPRRQGEDERGLRREMAAMHASLARDIASLAKLVASSPATPGPTQPVVASAVLQDWAQPGSAPEPLSGSSRPAGGPEIQHVDDEAKTAA